jgi:hypothetical protein
MRLRIFVQGSSPRDTVGAMAETPDPAALALIKQLYKRGLIDLDDIEEMADEAGPESAHLIRMMAIEAEAPSQADWEAERARRQFRVVRKED